MLVEDPDFGGENAYGPTDNPRENRQVGAEQCRTNNPPGSKRAWCLLKQGSVLTQNIFPRDFGGNSTGLQNCLAAEDQEFIEIKYGVAIMVKDNTFVGVFLPYFLAELPDTCIFACVFKLFLLNHPIAEGPG